MNLFNIYLDTWKKGFTLSGRANRKEYWCSYFGNILAFFLLLELSGILPSVGAGLISVFMIAVMAPSFTILVRRFHDMDRSGWWLLFLLVPIANLVVAVMIWLVPGTRGDNRFGPQPD